MLRVAVALILLAGNAAAQIAQDPRSVAAILLRQAKSLRCSFTNDTNTEFRDGKRTVNDTPAHDSVVYDNIDLTRGAARAIGNAGASDIEVTWVADGLWFIERAPNGNRIMTTIFPDPGSPTPRFIVIESRHWTIGQFVSGSQSTGFCSVLE